MMNSENFIETTEQSTQATTDSVETESDSKTESTQATTQATTESIESDSSTQFQQVQQITKNFIQNQIKKQPDIDEENNVFLFCGDYDKEIQHPSNAKSYIFQGDKLFFQGFPYSVELKIDDSLCVKNVKKQDVLDFDLKKCRVYESHEGTIIRVFNINNTWYTSTNRKLDALKSKWASKHTTFGHRFADAIRDIVDESDDESDDEGESCEVVRFEDKIKEKNTRDKKFLNKIYEKNLDPQKKYMFILKPSVEERIVCRPEPSPTIYHVGTFDSMNVLSLDDEVILNGNKIETPKEKVFKDLHELKNAVENINVNYYQGYILIQRFGDHDKHYKIINDKYRYLFSVRGNVPSLRFRYLQLRKYGSVMNLNEEMYQSFLDLYNFHNEAAMIEKEIYELCKNLHQKYLLLYVEKKKPALYANDPNISDTENDALQNVIHKSYLDTRSKTTVSKINDLLTCNKPSLINKLLNEKKKNINNTQRILQHSSA